MGGDGLQVGVKGRGERMEPCGDLSDTFFSSSVAGPEAVQSHFRHGEFKIPAGPV